MKTTKSKGKEFKITIMATTCSSRGEAAFGVHHTFLVDGRVDADGS